MIYIQGDHLSGKPGNVREFDSCRGNINGVARWLSGRASDLRSKGRGFEPQP